MLLWLACSAQATFYWDLNGATAGAGGPSPTGTWDTASLNWNATASGASATQVWGDNNEAVFSAGTDATGPFTVTVTGTRYCKNLFVEEGAVKFNTGTVFMVSTNPPTSLPMVAVASGASASFAGSGSGYIGGANGLNETGGGSLDMGSSEFSTGNTTIDGGTCFVRSITTTANPFGNSRRQRDSLPEQRLGGACQCRQFRHREHCDSADGLHPQLGFGGRESGCALGLCFPG